MRLHRTILAACGLGISITACTMAEPAQPIDLADDSSITISGPAEDCIRASSIRSTKVIDDYTIDFDTGPKIYRNRLPNRCPGLSIANKFSYEVTGSRLCNVDLIHVLRSYGGSLERSASCGLGEFQPIEIKTP